MRRQFRWTSRRRSMNLFMALCVSVFTASLFTLSPRIAQTLHTRVHINTTPSMPLGFYAESTPAKSDLISFCVPEPWGSLAMERHYRMGVTDSCADGGEPLLKRIVARPGDLVSESFVGVEINGKRIPVSAPLPLDSGKRPLQPFMSSQIRLQFGEVWVMGESPKSFDSRYYGPISTKLILAYWEPKKIWK